LARACRAKKRLKLFAACGRQSLRRFLAVDDSLFFYPAFAALFCAVGAKYAAGCLSCFVPEAQNALGRWAVSSRGLEMRRVR